VHIAKPSRGGLREREPIVPVAQSVLHALDLSDELRALRRLRGKFSAVAGSLREESILMHQLLCGQAIGFRNGPKDLSCHG
jgi:hypothetical protein